jgi:redox-sensitive bicupin YhaK (pirin superfamily)
MQSFIRHAVNGAEGEGASVDRLFPVQGMMNFDPFVLWDDFTISAGAGFPYHPHRGFEGITYVFQGSVEHKDNLGNDSTVTRGGLQRFTAGKGIVHSEMPSAQGVTRGIQMWVNPPSRLKQLEPDYQKVDAEDVPEREVGNGVVRVLSDEGSPLRLNTPVEFLDVQLDAGGEMHESVPEEYRGLVYVFAGSCEVNQQPLEKGSALFMEDTTSVNVRSSSSCRFMLCFSRPHGEPIRLHGPFVD